MQRESVVAVALAGGLGAVVKHMALVAAAARAVVLGARPDQLEVALGVYRVGQRLPEAGPAGAAVVFGSAVEQRQEARRTEVGAVALLIVQRAAAGPFGVLLEQYRVSRAGQ